ncbi:MAG: family 43 glycosylhydrolase [Clostridiaceae bacterium]|nr:family 43 glycosylhydrolase [Clostridiaceae bacterium]
MDRDTDRLLAYTRVPVPEEYAPDLAYSIHFALGGQEGASACLNRNYGILFAEARISADNTIIPVSAVKPYLFRTAEGGVGVAAVQVRTDGSDDAVLHGNILIWTLETDGNFSPAIQIDLHADAAVSSVGIEYDAEAKTYRIRWSDREGRFYHNFLQRLDAQASPAERSEPISLPSAPCDIEGAVPGNALAITPEEREAFHTRWTQVRQVGVRLPETVVAGCAADVERVRAELLYSDGSAALRDVEWDLAALSWDKPGTCRVRGRIRTVMQAFPVRPGFADPVVLLREGRYYFIATNDNTDTHGLYACDSDTFEGLFDPENPMREILPVDERRGLVRYFWAPEFHEIGGCLYILFAVSAVDDRIPQPQCQMMRLKPGGDLIDPASWEDPVPVRRADGSSLGTSGITLDMTYLESPRASYLIWSAREHFTTPLDTGSMLYIATTDPARPWILTSDPVLLSRPLFGWENIERTINNEGPYPLVRNGKVWLAYSAGSASAYSYAVGWLTADLGADLLDIGNWRKASAPALTYFSVPGIYGPGHNSFFVDKSGDTMLLYHGGVTRQRYLRSTGMRRVHFGRTGRPLLDLDAERDLDPAQRDVSMEVDVRPARG